MANPGDGRKTPRRSSTSSAFRISTRRTQRNAEEKERTCSPPGHQGRQGKENPLRSSASSAFRISTRRTQRDADGHMAKKEGPTHIAMRGFVHHTDTRGESGRRRLGAFVSWWLDTGVPLPSRAEAGGGFRDTRSGFRCFPFPPEPMKIATAVDLRQSTDPDLRQTWAPRAPRARRIMP